MGRRIGVGLPPRDIQYLEVNEANNPRSSFDLNLYNAELTIADLRVQIEQMANRFSQNSAKINAFVNQIRHFPAGHLAGGTHRNGSDFFNIYYEAEKWPGLPTEPGSVGDGHETSLVRSDPAWLEYTTVGDQYFNYSWWPYSSVAKVEHKLRPVNLLFHSFDVGETDAGACDMVKSIQKQREIPHRLGDQARRRSARLGVLSLRLSAAISRCINFTRPKVDRSYSTVQVQHQRNAALLYVLH